MQRIGILTSGGDCQALNGAMRGVAKGLYTNRKEKVEIYGIEDGYSGLIYGRYKKMNESDFENILNLGGTILGSSRQPFKTINEPDEKGTNKVKAMIENYKNMQLDALVILGGNGSHKTANLLSESGLNIVTLPKTIDNDIFGTEMTFGFASAVDIATEYIDRIRTTAASHKRIFIIEVMGNKAGWLTLNTGIAAGADIIVIPEIPYDTKTIIQVINKKIEQGQKTVILVVAEGIISKEESRMGKKELKEKRNKEGNLSSSFRMEQEIKQKVNLEVRSSVIGHIQRGGNPSAYDRILSSRLGVKCAELLLKKEYGKMVVMIHNNIRAIPLSETAGKKKVIKPEDEIVQEAKKLGICLGE